MISLSLSFLHAVAHKKYILKVKTQGSGPRPQVGQIVTIEMEGRLLSSSKIFFKRQTTSKRVGEENFVGGRFTHY